MKHKTRKRIIKKDIIVMMTWSWLETGYCYIKIRVDHCNVTTEHNSSLRMDLLFCSIPAKGWSGWTIVDFIMVPRSFTTEQFSLTVGEENKVFIRLWCSRPLPFFIKLIRVMVSNLISPSSHKKTYRFYDIHSLLSIIK